LSLVQIATRGSGSFYTKSDMQTVNHAIEENLPVTIFWYTALGRRYEEEVIFRDIEISYLMTESDSTPWEIG